MASRRQKQGRSNTLRIIGGQWRGRKLPFADAEGLRPTLDRVRETLFNWLQGKLSDARCLDLFAGSGALSFEALSRGALEVTMLEINERAIANIKQNMSELGVENTRLIKADAKKWLDKDATEKYDVVFLDPPFGRGLLTPVTQMLEHNGWLNDSALLYLEVDVQTGIPELPAGWQIIKNTHAGNTQAVLVQKMSISTENE